MSTLFCIKFPVSKGARSVNSPEVVLTSLWLPEESPAVEIIELATSEEIDDGDQNYDINCSFNNDKLRELEDRYRINKTARERRRIRNQNLYTSNTSTNRNTDEFIQNFYADISGDYINDNEVKRNKGNCFTMINRNILDSDSSQDSNRDIEIITTDNPMLDGNQWDPDNPYGEEYFTYDSELNKEKHTIWIYSFKNKSLLSEADFELVNGKDSSTSTSRSSESNEERDKNCSTNGNRIATPIPLYIPRLNLPLVPTLSTVTEISEIKHPSSSESIKSSQILQKRKNNWLKEIKNFENAHKGKSSNIVNWMALSPREKRRQSKYIEDQWNGSVLHLESPRIEDQNQFEVKAEIHIDDDEAERLDKSIKSVKVKEVSSVKIIVHDNCARDDVVCHVEAVADISSAHSSPVNNNTKAPPQIQPATRHTDSVEITDPIEKLESDNWIHVTKVEKETATYDYEFRKFDSFESHSVTNGPNSVDKLWMKNTAPLMKPPEWGPYASLAESNLSLHLSLGSIIHERKPWYRRVIRCIICCKYSKK